MPQEQDMVADVNSQDLQAELKARGVVDCKFYIRRKGNTTDEHVSEDAIHLLNAFIRGDMIEHAPIGDAVATK
jgi:hypothetical protein